MPWSDVNSPADPTLLDTIATCFKNGDLEGYDTTGSKLRRLLNAQHIDIDNQAHPIFKLAIWTPSAGASVQLALGFRKTLRRSPPLVTTANGAVPSLRFWAVTMGYCIPVPMAAQDAYVLVNARCTQFYDNERDNDPALGQKCRFGVIDQANRPLQPAVYFADAVTQDMLNDTSLNFTPLGPFPRYDSFLHDVQLIQVDPK
jgi:hypothetical protein